MFSLCISKYFLYDQPEINIYCLSCLVFYPFVLYSVNQLQTLNMETSQPQALRLAPQEPTISKPLIKAIITACLIVVLMIPTLLIDDLVSEREKRNEKVVTEVRERHFWLIPEDLSISGNVKHHRLFLHLAADAYTNFNL